jgi:hypothetical protein
MHVVMAAGEALNTSLEVEHTMSVCLEQMKTKKTFIEMAS